LDALTIKKQNRASHGSNIRNIRWADICDDDFYAQAQIIAEIVLQKIRTDLQTPIPPKAQVPSKPKAQVPSKPIMVEEKKMTKDEEIQDEENKIDENKGEESKIEKYCYSEPDDILVPTPSIPPNYGRHKSTACAVFEAFGIDPNEELNEHSNKSNIPSSSEEKTDNEGEDKHMKKRTVALNSPPMPPSSSLPNTSNNTNNHNNAPLSCNKFAKIPTPDTSDGEEISLEEFLHRKAMKRRRRNLPPDWYEGPHYYDNGEPMTDLDYFIQETNAQDARSKEKNKEKEASNGEKQGKDAKANVESAPTLTTPPHEGIVEEPRKLKKTDCEEEDKHKIKQSERSSTSKAKPPTRESAPVLTTPKQQSNEEDKVEESEVRKIEKDTKKESDDCDDMPEFVKKFWGPFQPGLYGPVKSTAKKTTNNGNNSSSSTNRRTPRSTAKDNNHPTKHSAQSNRQDAHATRHPAKDRHLMRQPVQTSSSQPPPFVGALTPLVASQY
jgi:hypothetical protein